MRAAGQRAWQRKCVFSNQTFAALLPPPASLHACVWLICRLTSLFLGLPLEVMVSKPPRNISKVNKAVTGLRDVYGQLSDPQTCLPQMASARKFPKCSSLTLREQGRAGPHWSHISLSSCCSKSSPLKLFFDGKLGFGLNKTSCEVSVACCVPICCISTCSFDGQLDEEGTAFDRGLHAV